MLMYVVLSVLLTILRVRALSNFDGDFPSDLGTQHLPANIAAGNVFLKYNWAMYVEFNEEEDVTRSNVRGGIST